MRRNDSFACVTLHLLFVLFGLRGGAKEGFKTGPGAGASEGGGGGVEKEEGEGGANKARGFIKEEEEEGSRVRGWREGEE